jgi:hypothetical protein
MVQRVLVNVNTSPDARVVCPDWDDPKGGFDSFEVFDPEVVGWGFSDDNSLASLFACVF